MKKGHVIKEVEPGSIADELGIEPGDRLISVDGHVPEDIFDYEYYIESPSCLVLIEKANGDEWEFDIENDYEDLGLTFENGLMSEYRSCRNKCIFCFIDQMPKGMRDTLYFKDDDSRLSYLQGNYITMTNMKDKDFDRIIKFRLSPINISVHTTNPELRCKMLHNRFAGKSLKYIDRLYDAGITMNGQIVLCKNINDGDELERTIKDLSRYIPYMESVSVVPVGITRFRDGLYPLEPVLPEDAGKTIDIIERWQKRLFKEHGIHFVHASDEFYVMAGRELPEEERYDDYPQLENGVGMLRLLISEVNEALSHIEGDDSEEEISMATGELAYDYLDSLLDEIKDKFPNRTVHLYSIKNNFFGEMITVAGLVTGQDLIEQLKGKNLGSRLILPSSMFKSGEEVFLDDITKDEVETALQVPVNIVKSSGQDFVNAVLHSPEDAPVYYEGYELKEIL